jgi:CheY-like chemotaxis protein
MPPDPVFQGLRLLVVEDEAIVAVMVEDMLTDLGCKVVQVAGTVEKGLAIVASITTALDGAVLDVNIGGEKVFPIADALIARGLPFIFATGYGTAGIEPRFAGQCVISKPFQAQVLSYALSRAFTRLG